MVVRTQCKGRKVSGLYIGARNVRRNFPKHTAAVEFVLGHLHIGCRLTPGFWHGQPEIRDPRLCEWLEFKLYRERSLRTPLPLKLVQAGRNRFRILPMVLPSVSLNGVGQSQTHFAGALVRQKEKKPTSRLHPV